jgi:hypothetical protein
MRVTFDVARQVGSKREDLQFLNFIISAPYENQLIRIAASQLVMAGFVPAISLRKVTLCHRYRDRRYTPRLRGSRTSPAMTNESY